MGTYIFVEVAMISKNVTSVKCFRLRMLALFLGRYSCVQSDVTLGY